MKNKTISFIRYAVRGTMDNRFLAMSIVASVGTGMFRGAANDEASFWLFHAVPILFKSILLLLLLDPDSTDVVHSFILNS